MTRILDSFFLGSGTSFARAWPSSFEVGRGRPDLPEALVSGEASSIEALCASYKGPLIANGRRGRTQTQFRVEAKAIDLLNSGLTVQFEDLAAGVPALRPWLRAIEEEIGMPAGCLGAAAFASPGENRGLFFHYDSWDVMIVPLRGPKHIELADNPDLPHPAVMYNPGYSLRAEDLAALAGRPPLRGPDRPQGFVVEPGMAVFMPAGCWHSTVHPEESLSLSLTFRWPRVVDLALARLRLELLARPELRAPAYGAWSADADVRRAAAERVAQALPAIAERATALTPAAVLAEAPTLEAAALYLDEETTFEPTPFFAYELAPDAEDQPTSELRVHSTKSRNQATLEIERRFVPACRWIAARTGRFALRELMTGADLGLDAAREVVTALTDAGSLCRIPLTRRV